MWCSCDSTFFYSATELNTEIKAELLVKKRLNPKPFVRLYIREDNIDFRDYLWKTLLKKVFFSGRTTKRGGGGGNPFFSMIKNKLTRTS